MEKLNKCSIALYALFCIFALTSCNNDEDEVFITSNPLANLQVDTVDVRVNKSDIDYSVSKEDAMKFSEAMKSGKEYKMEFYVMGRDTLLYLLNYERGWVIIAGDKRISPIVAESEDGEIFLNSPNENLMAWMESYADEIRVLRQYGRDVENEYTKLWKNISRNKIKDSKTKRKAAKSAPELKWGVVHYTYVDYTTTTDVIPHLVTTKWGQREPWNYKCPVDVNNGYIRCVTGCVAVSLAQIIHYMHYHLGKPTGLYHTINVTYSVVSGPTTNIGFSRSNYNANSTRWDDMALESGDGGNSSYVGNLMLDVGNRVGMSYSGVGSNANISVAAMANYGLLYSHSDYNFQTVKNDLQKSKPVNVTAYRTEDKKGHSWLIDGLSTKVFHYIIQTAFEYTENWMYDDEYYDSFSDLQEHYHINSPFDVIEEEGGSYATEYLRMNWGYDGQYDDGYYNTYPTLPWTIPQSTYNINKAINYDFR